MEKMFDFKTYGIKSNIKWAWQRMVRGFDDKAVWSVDYYLAQLIPLLIMELKENERGVPGQMFEEDDWDEKKFQYKEGALEIAAEKWNSILDEIAEGFQDYVNLWDFDMGDALKSKKFNRAFDLLREYFQNLWW